jgi:hypothetical protein
MRFWKSLPDGCVPCRRASILAILVALAAAGWGAMGCRAQSPNVGKAAYQPFYSVPAAPSDARGTLKGDYQWAAGSKTVDEAAARWREFLQTHQPPDGEYQDAFQRNYVRSAEYELMRAEYLLGRAREGDTLLRNLEDVRGGQ